MYRNTLFGVLALFLSASSYAEVRVGLILDRGGKDDKSFNAAAFKGAMEAEKELGVSVKVVESSDANAYQSLHRAFAQRKFDLIIGVGIAQQESVQMIAKQFPEQKFAIVDASVDLPNVRSLLFEEHEGSFLVGALAAMKSKTGTLGFIGGMDVPLIRRFEKGFEAGAKHVNPKAKLLTNYVGITVDAWNNPAKGKELAVAQYDRGADVIFAAAGSSGIGLFDAAEEKGKLAIGVDSNQNWVKPGKVLTSMLKRVDVAVKDTIRDVKSAKFSAGEKRYGLKNLGVDYVIDQYNRALISKEEELKLKELRKQIIEGKVSVPDYYKRNTAAR